MEKRIWYPIGIQTFSEIRTKGYVYVDKTQHIYNLLADGFKFVFLSRPRRFGKSLFLTTLQSFFEGKKELFKGLFIDNREDVEWDSYPVLHFDLSGAEATNVEKLEDYIDTCLEVYEERFQIKPYIGTRAIGTRFGLLIDNIAEKTGKQVVVLIDEYDKGITEVLDNADKLEQNQAILRPFFAQLKNKEQNIRFAMITGVARFSHYTIFSGLNQLEDISMSPAHAAICGITYEELVDNFQVGVDELGNKEGWSRKDTLEYLRLKYDSYRFTSNEVQVFNPFSLLNCLKSSTLGNYWLKSGTSKVFMTYLKRANFTLSDIEGVWKTQEQLEAVFTSEDPISLLFQAGYLTIKGYRHRRYQLGIPNGEVRGALVDDLMPSYMGLDTQRFNERYWDLLDMVYDGDPEGFLRVIQGMVKTIPYQQWDMENLEKTYHLTMHMIFMMLNVDMHSEMAQSEGRVDMVVETPKYVYVMEFKLDHSAEEALEQIDSKEYALPWEAKGRKVYRIGVSFSSQHRCIEGWKIEG